MGKPIQFDRKVVLKSLIAIAVASALVPTASAQSGAVLEEVIVTARKVQESMQDVPVAVSSLSERFVKDLNIRSVAQTLDFIPGATYISSSPGEQTFSIRGVSSGAEGASADSGVLVMVDNEVISRDFMRSSAMYDVQRVEVLRGPQGTTYGRNSTGGVIHTLNNTPSQESSGSLALDVGNYGYYGIDGYVNGALSDTVSGRLSGRYSDREGYSEDALTGDDLDAWEDTALRGQLLFDASEELSVLVRAHWSDEDGDNPSPRKALDASLPDIFRFDPPAAPYAELSSDPWKVQNSDDLYYERNIWGLSAEVHWEIGGLNLTSLTTYRDADDEVRVDLFGTPRDMVVQNSENDATTWSQEFRLDNAGSGSKLTWVVGAFFLGEEHERSERKEILTGVIAVTPLVPIVDPGEPWTTTQDFDQSNETDSIGLFGEVSYNLTENTALAVGGRYSYDEKSYDVFHTADGPASILLIDEPVVETSISEDWDAITGKVSLTHHFSDSTMIYASFSTGYKSGGFNPEPPTLEAAETPFDEETVQTFEIGAKTQWLEDRLRVNVTAFDSTYDDIQAEFFSASGATIIENVAEASILGAELEVTWLVTDNFSLMGSTAIYDHEYENFIDADGNDLSGNPIANVPDWTLNLSAIYSVPLKSGDLDFRVDYRNRDDIYDDADTNKDTGVRPGEEIVHARVAWTSSDESWNVALWGKNLTDQEEIVNLGPRSIMSQRHVVYSPPRTYGVSLSYSWM